MAAKQPETLNSIADFLFNAPLYTEFTLVGGEEPILAIYNRVEIRIDGFCKNCRKDFTFAVVGARIGDNFYDVEKRLSYDTVHLKCTRNDNHVYRYNILIKNLIVQKAGQYPSIADIAIDETRQKYKSVLKGDNWSEL